MEKANFNESALKGNETEVFKVMDASMDDGTADAYQVGDILICQAGPVAPGNDVVIVRPDGTQLRRVLAAHAAANTIAVHALNPLFKDETINMAEASVFNVVLSQRGRVRP